MTVKAWKEGRELTCSPTAGDEWNPGGWSEEPDMFTIFASWEDNNHTPHRIVGKYCLGSAQANLYYESGVDHRLNKQWKYGRLRMRGNNIKELHELYTLIRSGKILPTTSYEAEQFRTPIRQFADLWREFILLCRLTVSRLLNQARSRVGRG